MGEVVELVTQVARGLSRAHSVGVVHRDIKPGNIFFMEQDGEIFVKILDFGIAKQVDDVESYVTMTGQIIGTPHYVSPEQIEHAREAEPQNDLWSLAVVAYRALTGHLPFEGESVGAIAIAIDKARFTPVTAHDPSLPGMLDAWFQKAFARDPAARFGCAKELAAAFEVAAKDEPLHSVVLDEGSTSVRGTNDNAKTATATATDGDDDRTTRPDPMALAAPASEPVIAQSAAAEGEPTPKSTTPVALGELTLAEGTVTHIERTKARTTHIYGSAIALVAMLGGIAAGLLASGDKTTSTGAATLTAIDRTTSAPPEGTPNTATAIGETPPPAETTEPTATATATASLEPVAPSGEPATSETPIGGTTSAPVPSATTTLPPKAPPPAPLKKKKKDRGF